MLRYLSFAFLSTTVHSLPQSTQLLASGNNYGSGSQDYSVGEQARVIMELTANKTAEEMVNQLASLVGCVNEVYRKF